MFPYVDDEYKYTKREVDQGINNGSNAHISTYFNGYQGVDGSQVEWWYALAYGQNNPSDVVNLNYFVNTCKSVSATDVNTVFNQLPNNMYTNSMYETEEYTEAYDRVMNSICWVWGNYENGGLFCYKNSDYNNEITFMIENGYYSTEITPAGTEEPVTVYGFSMVFGGSFNASTYDFSKVMFMYDAVESAEGIAGTADVHAVYYKMLIPEKAHTNQAQIGMITTTPYGYLCANVAYPFEDLDDIMTDWFPADELLGGPDPMEIFNVSYCNVVERTLYFPFDYDGYTQLSGRPDGDMASESDPNSGANIGSADPSGANLDNDVSKDDPGDASIDNNPLDVVNSKLVLLYNPSASELQSFNDFLFSGITDSMYNVFKKLQSDPMQFIVSLGLVHFNPPISARNNISFGGYDTGVTSNIISRQMKAFDFGSINVKREFNNFLDYPIYSKLKIFLPNIGYRELNMDECRGSILKLIYNVDMLTGACVANIHVTRESRWSNVDCDIQHNVYSFNGNCMLQVPMSGTDNRGAIQALGQMLGGIASMATGNVAGGVSNIISGIAQEKITSERAGSIGSNYGYMSMQKPFLIAERPIVSMPIGFGGFEGFKAPIKASVGSLIGKGYTEIDPDTIWTNGFAHATDEEAQMIKDIMNGGVYL